MNQVINLRRAVPKDATALTALVHTSAAYEGEYRAIVDKYEISGAQVRRDQMFIAERSGQVLGFYSLITSGMAELDLMFVANSAQGTGVGKLLFQHMAATAATHGIQHVKIIAHPPALGFYQRMGARVVGAKAPAGNVTWERPLLELRIDLRTDLRETESGLAIPPTSADS